MPRGSTTTISLQPIPPLAWTLVALVAVLFAALVAVLAFKGYQQVTRGTTVGLMALEGDIAQQRQAPGAQPWTPRPAPAIAPVPVGDTRFTVRELPAAEQRVVTYNGRPLRKVREVTMKVTAYSPDERSCGKWADGITASGYSVWTNGMKLVAADTSILPFNTIVSVPGYNGDKPVPVLDRGGKIKGHRLDVLYPTHERALQWGVQDLTVTVWEYAD